MYEHIYICTLYGSDNPIYYKQQSIIVCAFQELFWFAERPRHRFHFLLLLFLLLSLLAPIVEHLCSITTPSSVCFSGILTLRKMNSCSCPSPWCCFYYLVPLRLGQDRTTKKKKNALIATMMGTELICSRWRRIMKSFSFLLMVCAASSLLIHFSVWPFRLTGCSLLRLFKDIYLGTEKWKPDIQDRLIFVCESSCHFCSARVCYHVWTSNYSLG